MKIRMITFHTPINYGAVLQAYALQTYLETQCEDVKIINYKTDTLIQKYKYFKKNNTPRNIIGNIVKLKDYSKYKTRKRKFEEFSNTFYDLTERVTDREGCSKEARNADFVFTGSDQVFNPTRKYQEEISTFYLDFDVGKAKRVAYAPSFGVGSIPIGKRDMVKNYLEKFDYLSVRELNGKDIVKSLIGKDPLCVVDPVLLLQEKQWESIEKKVEVPENYLLCYHLYNSTLEKEVVEKVAQKLGLKIVCITPNIFSPIKSDICFKDVGPEEFVYLLRHASFVVTDSFHGVIFSTLFKKQFYLTVASESTKSRMVSFLNRMGMEKRICIDSDDIDEEPIDYSIVTPLLNREIELSKQYITDCLNGQDVTVLKNVIEEKPIKTIEDIQNYCTGCGTCIAICPTNAITMQKNKEGFEVPVIDKEKCIQCGKCVKMCHANKYSNTRNNANIEKAFYGRIKDNKEVLNYSSSGGIYYVLANKTIKEGGITYGAVLNKENWKVEHLSSEESSLKAQMKSKYVQSSTYKAFAKVKEDLEKGKQVLFCGTPCQVAGLKKLVGERENLITIDFICHGVPSPAILKDKIAELEKQYQSKVKEIFFRTKYNNWSMQKLFVEFENGKVYFMDANNDDYFRLFLNNYILRTSCYQCQYSNEKHVADITLADYWGIKQFSPEENDEKGMSLILINTAKGQALLDSIAEQLEMKPLPLEKARYVYKSHDTYSESKRTVFFKEYIKNGYTAAVNKLYPKDKLKVKIIKELRKRQYQKIAKQIEKNKGGF